MENKVLLGQMDEVITPQTVINSEVKVIDLEELLKRKKFIKAQNKKQELLDQKSEESNDLYALWSVLLTGLITVSKIEDKDAELQYKNLVLESQNLKSVNTNPEKALKDFLSVLDDNSKEQAAKVLQSLLDSLA